MSKKAATAASKIDPLQDPRWAEFIERHSRASVFHTPGWLEALRRTYGYDPVVYTTAPPGVGLTNGVVFCRVYSRLTGRRMVSLPFSDHCEPLVDHPDDMECLLESLKLEGSKEGWRYIELRPRTAWGAHSAGMQQAQAYSLHMVDLRPSLEQIFRRFHKDSIQRKIRRAEHEGLAYEEGRSEAILEKFYRLLLLTRRRHHLPPHPRAWFRNLMDCVGEQGKIRVASKDGLPIASILTHAFKDVITYKYGCSDQRFHNLGGMQLLIWRAIQDGKRNGARQFDLGRSARDNSGLIRFKDRWGAVRSQLTYRRYPVGLVSDTSSDWRAKMARRISLHIPDSLLVAAWRIKVARRICAHFPDKLLIVAGKLLYKHLG